MRVPTLTPGASVSERFAGPGQPDWYKLTQPAGQELIVHLGTASETGRTRLYAGAGSMPTTESFDYRSEWSEAPDARLVLPAPERSRTVYLLAQPEGLPAGLFGYTLVADVAAFGVESISLREAGNTGPVTVTVIGSWFEDGMAARLRLPGGSSTIDATSVTRQDSGTALVTFDLTGAPRASTTWCSRRGAPSRFWHPR